MFQWLREHPEEFSQYCHVETMKTTQVIDQLFAGLGMAREKPEGTPLSYQAILQGPSKRYIPQSYALAYQVTREMKRDDQYGIIRRLPKELAQSIRGACESTAIVSLNGAFTTTTTADGVTLCNSAHPQQDASVGFKTDATQSNTLSASLSVAALQSALNLFEGQADSRGNLITVRPDKIWIPYQLQFTAWELLNSTYQPYSGENTRNSVAGRLEPVVLHYLTDVDNWFISSTEHKDKGLKFFWRSRPVMDAADDFDTKGEKHSIWAAWVTGATDWRGWVGSAP
jgi:hypothetical protein